MLDGRLDCLSKFSEPPLFLNLDLIERRFDLIKSYFDPILFA